MIGIIVSYKRFSTNGFMTFIAFVILVEALTNLIEKLSAFDPTKLVFLLNTICKFDSKSGSTRFSKKYFENSTLSSSTKVGLPYFENILKVA
jgi:hypothetical protein